MAANQPGEVIFINLPSKQKSRKAKVFSDGHKSSLAENPGRLDCRSNLPLQLLGRDISSAS